MNLNEHYRYSCFASSLELAVVRTCRRVALSYFADACFRLMYSSLETLLGHLLGEDGEVK
jgi:hypothetical protein